MKKFLSIVLCAAILSCLFGCGNGLPSPTETTPPATEPMQTETQPTETTAPTYPLPQYSLPLICASTPTVTEEFYSADGTQILRYTYQDMTLTLEDPQVADAITIDFLNLVDPGSSTMGKILRDAQQSYDDGGSWSTHTFSRIYHPTRLDSSVLSLYGTQKLSSGTSHGSAAGISVTYDLLTGQRLSLRQILQDNFSADGLAQAIIEALSDYADEGILYSDHAYVITEMFSTNTPVDNWYLSATGLCFYFAPYEIAPYSIGIITAEVPYEALTGLLKDEYFPPEEVELLGTIDATDFKNADLDSYNRFAELVLDPDGTEHLIHAYGSVGSVRLELGTWSADGSFTPEATLFAAATLCQGDALVIRLPDSLLGQIRLCYTSEGNTISIPLSALLVTG